MPERQDTTPAQRARDLMTFCDGLEEAGGWDRYIGHARRVARDLEEALEQLDGERAARVAMQAERDRLRVLLEPRKPVYDGKHLWS